MLSTEETIVTMPIYVTGARQLFGCLLMFAVLVPPGVSADDLGPGEIIKNSTDRIMALVEGAPAYFDETPERYFRGIGAELDAVVDFRGFARGVMGEYASGARHRSLDAAGQQQLKNQLNRFAEVLRQSLINTYSRGLLAFGGSRTELASTDFSSDNARLASVSQRVYSPEGNIYTIRYVMGQYKDGSWKLRNMIIEGISLGEIYRRQFEAAAQSASGDIDTVIADWGDDQVQRLQEDEIDGSQ